MDVIEWVRAELNEAANAKRRLERQVAGLQTQVEELLEMASAHQHRVDAWCDLDEALIRAHGGDNTAVSEVIGCCLYLGLDYSLTSQAGRVDVEIYERVAQVEADEACVGVLARGEDDG